ncbi:hypothetical protein [Streptomyces chryseus]|uniref:hypothetical protein n=1 Tax=Streptomyces chryseus TaxID=68186 RepID=UPI00110F6B49|nr:hypothetical protein [Streptomyces chryseus]GGX36747.1 hypothetical protein GCM10010353_59900 [Streptomyces chryseus]
MSEEPTPPAFATKDELIAFVREQEAAATNLAAELLEDWPADLLHRVAALQRNMRRIASEALELEVRDVVVPDYPPDS